MMEIRTTPARRATMPIKSLTLGQTMKRMFWFLGDEPEPQIIVSKISREQHRQLLELLSEIGLNIVAEQRGPVPLLTFGRRVLERLHSETGRSIPLPNFADALKHVIKDMRHDQLKIMSPTDCLAVGYVYNAEDPDTWPIKSRL